MQPATTPTTAWAAAMHRCAQPLIALATQLRTAVPARPAETLTALAAAVERFEQELTQAGGDARSVAAASYLLCTWLDEVTSLHDWATVQGPAHSLLLKFHGEADGGTRLFQLLDRLMQQPANERPLLELFHVCLSLGLQGRWQDNPQGPRELAALRTRLAGLLQLHPAPMAIPLSGPWQPAVAPRKAWQGRHVLVAGLVLTALAALGVYSTSQWLLARQVDQVFASLQGLEGSGRASPALAVAHAMAPAVAPAFEQAATPGRMATALAADVAAGFVAVRDEPHRSLVVLAAEPLFLPETTQVVATQVPLLERIAKALAASRGKVVVTAYAQPDAPRSARLASASQLADEWARQVARVLERHLPAASVASEGRVAASATATATTAPATASAPAPTTEPVGTRSVAARRSLVEITLFP